MMEGSGTLADRVEELWLGMKSRGDHLYTSAFTLGELLVKPVNAGAQYIEQGYLKLLRHPKITVLPFDYGVAPAYARIRSDRSIRAPDAIQLACAAAAQIDLFITNDERLSKKHVSGIKFITSLDRAPI
jgi:predicted nucleic acid-binding protein